MSKNVSTNRKQPRIFFLIQFYVGVNSTSSTGEQWLGKPLPSNIGTLIFFCFISFLLNYH